MRRGVTLAATGLAIGAAIVAQQKYDGSLGGDPADSYLGKSPTNSAELFQKEQEITLWGGRSDSTGFTPGIAVISTGVAVLGAVATAALVTTDIVTAALADSE